MTNQIQQAYFELLSNPCPKCDVQPFAKFESLRDHVRREHEHFYCDLCVANLKIFTFERRCYNRQQLGIHRRVGDADNTSHRGHPLCEYCDVRYLDRDELFRHLRREHFFCHFCDAEGTNQFYRWVFVFWPFVCVEQDNTQDPRFLDLYKRASKLVSCMPIVSEYCFCFLKIVTLIENICSRFFNSFWIIIQVFW